MEESKREIERVLRDAQKQKEEQKLSQNARVLVPISVKDKSEEEKAENEAKDKKPVSKKVRHCHAPTSVEVPEEEKAE